MKQKYNTQIIRIDSLNAFLEILNSSFSIGKVQINFCTYDEKTKAQTKKLQIYIDVEKFMAFCEDVSNLNFQRSVFLAQKENKFKGETVTAYTSFFVDMGGVNERNVAAKFDENKAKYPWIQQGKGISRQFKIQAGKNGGWLFRAEYGLGVANAKGLIVPEGKPADSVNIPVSEDDIRKIAVIVKMHYMAYLNQFYSKFNESLFPNQKCEVFIPKK